MVQFKICTTILFIIAGLLLQFGMVSAQLVMLNLNLSGQNISQPQQTIQDISAGLYMITSPNPVNLVWNSTGNFSVYVENRNDMSVSCKLSLSQPYDVLTANGDYSRTDTKLVYSANVNLGSVTNLINSNSYSTIVNISAPENCNRQIVPCSYVYNYSNMVICGFIKPCNNDSIVYLVQLSCSGSSYDGSVFSRETANLVNKQNSCIENWNCTDWSSCNENGMQYRTCSDSNNCGTTNGKPIEKQPCDHASIMTASAVSCEGCQYNNSCIPYGTRLIINNTSSYCDIGKDLAQQKPDKSVCQNNYECLSNYCSNGSCVDLQAKIEAQQTILDKISSLLNGIVSFFNKFFGKA